MICGQPGGCSLDLPPGASHFGLDACVAALRACSECGGEITLPIHPGCAPSAVAKRVTRFGVKHVEERITDAVVDWLKGEKAKPDDEEGPRRPRRGARFEP